MQPRGFLGTFITIAVITALPFALLWSWLYSVTGGVTFGEALRSGIGGGLIFGTIFGFAMAFFIRVVTIKFAVQDKAAFLSRMNVALAEIGYHPESQAETLLTYKPSLQAGLFSGKISIQIEQSSATIVGPSAYLKRLQKRMAQPDNLRGGIALAASGATLAQVCQACGAEVPEKARFCLNCGKEVAAASPSSTPAQHTGVTTQKQPRRWWRALSIIVLTVVVSVPLAEWGFRSLSTEGKSAIALVLIMGSFLALMVGIVVLVVRAIRKRKLKGSVIFTGVSLVLLMLGGVMVYQVEKETSTKPEPTATLTSTPAPAPVETLEQVLAKAANITSVKYDMVADGQVVTVRWKGNKTRADVTMNGVSAVIFEFADTRTKIAYLPAEKLAEQQELAAGEQAGSSSPAGMAKEILKQNPATLGSETIDGKPSLLIEATGDDGVKSRVWIEKEHGFPLRLDNWTPTGKFTIEWKNLEFFYIPDSMFELPPGIEVKTVPPPAPAPSPTPTPKPSPVPVPIEMPRLYTHPDFRYSIEALGGWTINDTDKTFVTIRPQKGAAVVRVWASTSPVWSLESWMDWRVRYLRSTYSDYQEMSRTTLTLPGGLPAYAIVDKLTLPGIATQRFLRVLAVKGNRQIEVEGRTWDTDWDNDRAQLEKVAYSLAIAD